MSYAEFLERKAISDPATGLDTVPDLNISRSPNKSKMDYSRREAISRFTH